MGEQEVRGLQAAQAHILQRERVAAGSNHESTGDDLAWARNMVLLVLAVAFISYTEIKEQFDAVASKPEVTSSFIAEFRQRYPEYNNLTGDQLLDAVVKFQVWAFRCHAALNIAN